MYVKFKNTHIMKKQAEKQTNEELRKQLQNALKEVKSNKAELKKVKREKEDLELKVNLLEYLKDPENQQKKSKLSPQWQKIAEVFLAIHTGQKTS